MKKRNLPLTAETVEEFCNEAQELISKINNIENNRIYYWFIAETLEKCLKLVKAKKVCKANIEFTAMVEFLKADLKVEIKR